MVAMEAWMKVDWEVFHSSEINILSLSPQAVDVPDKNKPIIKLHHNINNYHFILSMKIPSSSSSSIMV